jgi:hypothetical protein
MPRGGRAPRPRRRAARAGGRVGSSCAVIDRASADTARCRNPRALRARTGEGRAPRCRCGQGQSSRRRAATHASSGGRGPGTERERDSPVPCRGRYGRPNGPSSLPGVVRLTPSRPEHGSAPEPRSTTSLCAAPRRWSVDEPCLDNDCGSPGHERLHLTRRLARRGSAGKRLGSHHSPGASIDHAVSPGSRRWRGWRRSAHVR